MLCIKKMNPLKKCNREEAAVQGMSLSFRWNGEAPFWAEPVTAAWPASGTSISTSPYALSQPERLGLPALDTLSGVVFTFYKFRF